MQGLLLLTTFVSSPPCLKWLGGFSQEGQKLPSLHFLLSTPCFSNMQSSLHRTPQTALIPVNRRFRCTGVCVSVAWVLLLQFIWSLTQPPVGLAPFSFIYSEALLASLVSQMVVMGCVSEGSSPPTEPSPEDTWCKQVAPWHMKDSPTCAVVPRARAGTLSHRARSPSRRLLREREGSETLPGHRLVLTCGLSAPRSRRVKSCHQSSNPAK